MPNHYNIYYPPINWKKNNKFYAIDFLKNQIVDITKEYNNYNKNKEIFNEPINAIRLSKGVFINQDLLSQKEFIEFNNQTIEDIIYVNYTDSKVYTLSLANEKLVFTEYSF